MKHSMSAIKKTLPEKRSVKPQCGLCGKRVKLTKTDCCDKWICDDEDTYVMFSYARNSCIRNHRRFTLCGAHETEKHKKDWKSCTLCLKMFPAEMYDWYGSNEYNFEKLETLLPFLPIRCGSCGCMIFMSRDGYCSKSDGTYVCENCYE